MKTWSKADLLSFFLVIFGIACLILCSSNFLAVICFLFSSIMLSHCVYKSRYDLVKYRDILCHYHSILQSSKDGWIAWSENNEYISSSKKFRNLFGIKDSNAISVSDIVSSLERKDADEFIFKFNKLKRSSTQFCIIVTPLNIDSKLEIRGEKASLNESSTIILWCSDITYTSSLISNLENKLFTAEETIESLQDILNIIPIPIWKRDENLKISYCNAAYADALNIQEAKIIKNNIPLIPGTLFGQGHSLAENARKSSRNQSIIHSIVIKGTRKKLAIHENHASRGNLVGYAIDVSVEDALSTDLDRVVTSNYEVLENISAAIAIFGENTRLVFFNSAYQKLMKLDSNWLHSKPTYAEVLDERRNNRQLPEHADFQAFKKSQLAMFTSITAPTQDLTHLPNGKTLSMLIAPYPLGGLLFVFEDVTDSLALQRKNNTLLAVHKETIDHLHEGIAVYGSDNRLKIVNNSMLKILRIDDKSALEMKGLHLSDMLVYMKDRIDYETDWEEFRTKTISNLTDRTAKTGKLNLKDNSVILFSYIPLPDGAHMISYIDITDTCVVEKAIMEKDQAMQEAHRSRYEFVSSISVELREPINSLIGFSELLSREYYGALNKKQREYCKYILSSSNQLYQLINNLLEMVLIDLESIHLELSPFSIKDAVTEVVLTVEKRSHEKGINIITHFENSDLEFEGDRKRIKQCLFNILTNAVQISPINRQLIIRTICDNENLRIIIKDDGNIGETNHYKRSDRAFLHKIFEYNAASMSIVKSLLEMHDGNLKIKTDSNGFSYVLCTLPIKTKCNNFIGIEEVMNSQEEINEEGKEKIIDICNINDHFEDTTHEVISLINNREEKISIKKIAHA